MTLRECLTVLGFNFVADSQGEILAYHKPTACRVTIREGSPPAVWRSGSDFPLCLTVGDLRSLLRMMGAEMPPIFLSRDMERPLRLD